MPVKNKTGDKGILQSSSKGKKQATEKSEDSGDKHDDCSDLTDNNHETDESTSKSFPQKLFDILSNEENAAIISWLPHGNGFVIHKKKAFANEILPKHFKASKFTSFTRKLNRWGFSRAPRGPETGAYFHKMFGRDKPEMVLQMTSNSGNKVQTTTQGGPLLPVPTGTVQMMMPTTPGTMPFYMPQTQMAMLTPQQQQAFWHQQMQLYQFQQMQMFQFQQQQAAAASGGAVVGTVQPMMFPSMMMPMPIPVPVVTATTTNEESKAVKQEDTNNTNSKGDNGNDDFPSVDVGDVGTDTETARVGI